MEGNLICRLCLFNNEEIVSIFGDRQREAKLQEKLLQYLNLDVSGGLGLWIHGQYSNEIAGF